MRARFINEIKKGGSGWESIGVGSAALTRFYDKLVEFYPDTAESLFSLTHNSSDYITSMVDKAAKILNCDPNKIKYLQKLGFGSNSLLDRWVETLIELSHIEPIILNDEEYNEYDGSVVKYSVTITPLIDWDMVVVTKTNFYSEKTSQTNYLIKTPYR